METVDPFGLVGSRLDDKYIIESSVAEGGFGVVYRGLHRALQTTVAIKVLKIPPELSESARNDFARRFLEEAQTIAKLQHPAIVRVMDFGVSGMPVGGTAPWMVLEWLDGQTLQDYLEANPRRHSPQECLQVLRPVLEALAVAHEMGIAHRDIKPANIILPSRGPRRSRASTFDVARLLDFGISKAMAGEDGATSGETKTASTMTAFSLGYAAPEQLGGLRTGPWTDVHAMALVLTELLCAQFAYAGEDKMEVTMAILSPTRPTPAAHGVDVGGWEPVFRKALAIKSADRFKDAGELLSALEASLPTAVAGVHEESVDRADARSFGIASTLRPSTMPMPASASERPGPSRRTALLLGAGVVLGALAALGWLFSGVRPTSSAEAQAPVLAPRSAVHAAALRPAAPVVAVPRPAAPVVAAPQPAALVVAAPQPAAPVVAAPQPAAPVVAAPQPAAPVVAAPQPAAPVVATATATEAPAAERRRERRSRRRDRGAEGGAVTAVPWNPPVAGAGGVPID